MRLITVIASLVVLACFLAACGDVGAAPVEASQSAGSVDPAAAAEPDEEPDSTTPALKSPPQRGLLDRTANPQVPTAPVNDESGEAPWTVSLKQIRPYLQPVEYPNPPRHAASRHVTAVTMSSLQQAIAPNTVISVSGTLTATQDDMVTIGEGISDLTIRFEEGASIEYVGETTWSGLFRIMPTAKRIRFEAPRLIAGKRVDNACAGIEFVWDDSQIVAQDIAIVDGQFIGLNYAIQAHNGCRRLLVQDCTARGLIDYFIYGAKIMEDVTIQGCTAHGVSDNHVIRLFDADRVNIFRNDLKVDSIQGGQMKRTIWVLTGRQVTIAGNRTHDGRVTIGPNPVAGDSSPADRVGPVNVVFNRITHTHTNTPIELLSGAHDVFLTGNVVDSFTDAWLGIDGWNEHRRPITNIRWTDGTVLNGKVMTGNDGVAIGEPYNRQDDIGAVAKPPSSK